MPIPANDAFSLGLAHDQPRRSSSRTRTPSLPRRSSSPKVPSPTPSVFSSPAPSGIDMAGGVAAGGKRGHKRKASSRQDSQHSISLRRTATIEELVEEVDAQILARQAKKAHVRNDSSSNKRLSGKDMANDKTVSKIDWEIPRKALHSSIGFFTIYLWTSGGSCERVVIALSSALAVLVPIDILRLRYPMFERAFEKCVGIFMRETEKKTSNGVIWYILGVNSVLVALPLDIAVVSVIILSWADTAASTFGRMYGRLTPRLPARLPILGLPLAPRKSVAGFIAATITGAAVAVGFWALIGPMRESGIGLSWTWEDGVTSATSGNSACTFGGWAGLLTIGAVTGLVTGVAEALDLGSIDDNLSLPIITGGCLWGLFKVLGWIGSMLS
ncbi:hypothetical protein ID866_7681 [Astraeus odoratus]|nr:hypothetical protein ID866_7681 [Astraeus odoratus]